MRNDWILDVLADLRRFAADNDMPHLAEQLDDTALIATAEIASKQGRSTRAHGDDGFDRIGTTGARAG
ncbi:hypothetical protein KDD17_02250 [Sulfitobacter albidus]|uniref:Uncharacterized protein n=1 Tax=Sulfitobacter albidus TaxID=2829501 RepID=A0A975JEL3_9RHOB|nr:hypothetical protein [Sulfitobacter albidus]QUJ76902.1 hypothetical protein KDD17_02250 [Sulfitobacter albidus]